MKFEEAVASIKSIPEMRRACLVVLEACIAEQEKRLLTTSTRDSDEIVLARQYLEGARTLRDAFNRSLGSAK